MPKQHSRSSHVAHWTVAIACLPLLIASCGNAPQAGTTATATPASTPSPIPTATPMPQFSDPLTKDTGQWPVSPSGCHYANGGYEDPGTYCSPYFITVADGEIAVDAKVTAETTPDRACTGLIWRASDQSAYVFAAASGGNWAFFEVGGGASAAISSGEQSPMRPGLNVTNTLAVVFRGIYFTFMVNGVQVGTAVDNTLTGEGFIGVAAATGCTVVFNNFAYFT